MIGITTGGAQGMTTQERFAVIKRFKPEMASANGGSINFCFSKLAENTDFKYEWEKPLVLCQKGRHTKAHLFAVCSWNHGWDAYQQRGNAIHHRSGKEVVGKRYSVLLRSGRT